MNHARNLSWLISVALFAVLVSQPVTAVNPSIIMVYGDGLQRPIFVQTGVSEPYNFLWGIGRGGVTPESWVVTGRRSVLPRNLDGRRYVKFAVFWPHDRWGAYRNNPDLLNQLNPEDASQHGRLYLPRGAQPPAVVATAPLMLNQNGVPVPDDVDDFVAGWTLNTWDVSAAKRLGIPGL